MVELQYSLGLRRFLELLQPWLPLHLSTMNFKSIMDLLHFHAEQEEHTTKRDVRRQRKLGVAGYAATIKRRKQEYDNVLRKFLILNPDIPSALGVANIVNYQRLPLLTRPTMPP